MEFLREIRKVEGSELTIKVPDEFKETEVEILILPLDRDSDSESKISTRELKKDITEALDEVKMIREGKLPEKTARELLSEL
ncbi:MAG: hypothetical protein GY950_12320 [bacterium]|nr:hypothetical protein [bacterium]